MSSREWPSRKELRDLLEVLGVEVLRFARKPGRWTLEARFDGRECSFEVILENQVVGLRAEAREGRVRPARFGVVTKGGLAAQARRAEGTLVLAAAFSGDDDAGPRAVSSFVALLAETLGDVDDWAFSSLAEPVIGRVPPALWVAGAGLSVGTVAAFFAGLFVPELLLLHLLSYYSAPAAAAALAVATGKRYALLAAHDRAADALYELKRSPVFERVASIGRVESRWPRIGIRSAQGVGLGEIPVRVAALEAKSSRHGLELGLRLHRAVRPKGLVEGLDLLPESWAVLGLAGPDEALSSVPSLPGEARSPGSMRALLTEGHLEAGVLEDWLVRLEPALSATTAGPYR